MPRYITLRVKASEERDVDIAIALWKLAWASGVVLGDIEDDGLATISVKLADDWERGPSGMVDWVKSKLST